MLSWLKERLGLSQTYQTQSDEKLLTLEREIQNLRLELTFREAEQQFVPLQLEIGR